MPLTRLVKLDDGQGGEVWLNPDEVHAVAVGNEAGEDLAVYMRGDGEICFDVADTPSNRAKLGMVE